ncbi:MAG: hypothetical protein AB8G77_17940 [Rhodothermales bacterium]
MDIEALIKQIFSIEPGDDAAFETVWQQVYTHQRKHNPIYNRYCKVLNIETRPYLPIEAFKHAPIASFSQEEADLVFQSSGTGKGVRSRHFVRDKAVYEHSLSTHFCRLLGEGPHTLLAYLPHYQEMGATSSLLYMVEYLVEHYGNEHSGFFLHREMEIQENIDASVSAGYPVILFGAAFGLLDLIEKYAMDLPANAVVIETGGMKTYRQEITRDELHHKLAEGVGVDKSQVWSEYGMCELLSQCYAQGGAVFMPPPWMRFEIMNPENPLERQVDGVAGVLALIDLANLHSVSAILTQDRAIQRGEGFEVLGRLSGAELRGCNFLLEKT